MTKLLGILVLGCAAVLTDLWFDHQGNVKNTHWQAPSSLKLDLGDKPAPLIAPTDADVGRFVAILDRPLFSPSRRPPPPPPPPAPPPPPDPFANLQLLGIFTGAENGGIMARIEGRVRRVRINESVGAWTLKSTQDREATFASGDSTRVLRLAYVRVPVPAASVAPPGGAAVVAPPGISPSVAQQMQDEARDRLRRRNEIRARAGFPPLTE